MKKILKKVFTKNKPKDIINKNYNPLKVNYKLIYEREGIYMESKKEKKEKFVSLLFKICSDLKIKNAQEEVKNFLTKNRINY